jgi:hypothetical protein
MHRVRQGAVLDGGAGSPGGEAGAATDQAGTNEGVEVLPFGIGVVAAGRCWLGNRVRSADCGELVAHGVSRGRRQG